MKRFIFQKEKISGISIIRKCKYFDFIFKFSFLTDALFWKEKNNVNKVILSLTKKQTNKKQKKTQVFIF